jgi:hypothetical protein
MKRQEVVPSGNLPDAFDLRRDSLLKQPAITETRASVHRVTETVLGITRTFIVQTIRQAEVGDTIFLECFGRGIQARLILPPKVADTIARQRDALGTAVRRKQGQRVAAELKAQGKQPGFLRKAAEK